MAWTTLQFSPQEVNAAGRLVAEMNNFVDLEYDDKILRDYDSAVNIIYNWRSSHGYPLNTFQMNLRRAAKQIDGTSLIAQRTKRLQSIALKLRRFPSMKLTQMQDIGGCRAVVSSVADVQSIKKYYEDKSQIKHKLISVDDYIESPQKTGYRGVHLVYRYHSDRPKPKIYNELKIEMQIRSQFQHAWATAVETVGTFVREALKSSMGSDDWLRFFALMGSAIARREGTPIVPNTPPDNDALSSELKHFAEKLNVAQRLRAYGEALKSIEGDTQNASWYLLELDPIESKLLVTGFRMSEINTAVFKYSEAEKKVKDHPGTDAVLVSVDSIAALPRAYPNYFADTRVFLDLLQQALSGENRRIQKKPIRVGA